jgi:hypothetical protein
MSEAKKIRLELTEEQKAKVKATTGKQANALELELKNFVFKELATKG